MSDGTFDPNDFLGSLDNDPLAFTAPPVKETTLTDDEKKSVIDSWNSGISDLKTIIQKACGDGVDGRSFKGKAVKAYLAQQNLKARPSQVYAKREAIELTEANKEFIANNAANMKPLEITRVLFDDGMLSPLSLEFRKVKEYYDTLDGKVKALSDDENTGDYNPPRNEAQALARVNRYVLDGMDATKLTPRNRECIQKMIRFMHTHRFIFEMNLLPKKSERELFESSFVRFIYDKPDLTEEEIDLYLNQCSDIVGYQRMQAELVMLIDARQNMMEVDQKMPMALVDAIGKLRSDMDDNFKRQKNTLNDLNGKRSSRLDKINSSSESVIKLIEAFRDETQRQHIIRVLENRKNAVESEIKRLETVEDLHFHLYGAAKEEVK